MSLGRSSRSASLALLRKNLRKCCPPLHLHPPSPFIMVVWCVARILDTDVGKTLMNMEMLKFLRARTSARCFHRHQLGLPQFPRLCYNLSNSGFTLYCWASPLLLKSFQHLHYVPSLHRHCAVLLWTTLLSNYWSRSSSSGLTISPIHFRWYIKKIIHFVVFNKVFHIVHSSPSVSFSRTPSNDRLWLP